MRKTMIAATVTAAFAVTAPAAAERYEAPYDVNREQAEKLCDGLAISIGSIRQAHDMGRSERFVASRMQETLRSEWPAWAYAKVRVVRQAMYEYGLYTTVHDGRTDDVVREQCMEDNGHDPYE